jgi:hypothetical protein
LVSSVLLAQTGAQPAAGERKEAMTAKAHVAVIHASAAAPAVDVIVNGSPAIKGLAFGKSETKEFMGGPAKIELKAGDKVVLTKNATLAPDKMYTIVAFGPADKLDAQIIEAKAPAAGKAHVFFFHASPDAGNVDLNVDTKTVAKGFAMGKTHEATLDAGKHTIDVLAGSADPALTTALDAKADTCYCVVVGGMAKGTPKLQAIVASHTKAKKAAMTPAPKGEK